MKRFAVILALLFFGSLSAATYRVGDVPNVQNMDSRRYVSNPDAILDPDAVVRIDTLCAALRREGVAQVAVVAVDDIDPQDPFLFAVELFRAWGVGRKGADNGLGVLLVRDLHEIRFVTGGGLEGVLTDAMCRRIQMQYMLPYFRQDDYSAGMVAGMDAVAAVLRGGELYFGEEGEEGDGWIAFGVSMALAVLLLLLVMAVGYMQRRCPKCRKFKFLPQSTRNVELTPTFRTTETTYVCSHCGHTERRRKRELRDDNFRGGGGGTIIGGFGGMRGGGGSFGGGGFGGGSFGGGGAGSRW